MEKCRSLFKSCGKTKHKNDEHRCSDNNAEAMLLAVNADFALKYDVSRLKKIRKRAHAVGYLLIEDFIKIYDDFEMANEDMQTLTFHVNGMEDKFSDKVIAIIFNPDNYELVKEYEFLYKER